MYDCNGNIICTNGGEAGNSFENCPDFVPTNTNVIVPCASEISNCIYENPITDLPFIDSLITTLSVSSNCYCYPSLDMVDFGGVTAFLLNSGCIPSDGYSIMYDCEGNILCTYGGFFEPPYCTGEVTYDVVETLWTCEEGILIGMGELPWMADLDLTHHQLSIETYEGQTVYYYESCFSSVLDATILYDSNGEELCMGNLYYNFEGCPGFVPSSSEILLPCVEPACDFEDPIADLPFVDSLITFLSQPPECYYEIFSSLEIINFEGTIAFLLIASDMIPDAPDQIFDCEGNLICASYEEGNIDPPFCTSYGSLEFIETLWTCEDGVLPVSIVDMNLTMKVFLEGPLNENGIMTPMDPAVLEQGHPYGAAPYNYDGPELTGTIPSNAVDYILIELREDFGMEPLAQQVAFVLDNGNIRLEDGNVPNFWMDGSKTYQVWLRHHNHLDIVSAIEINPEPNVYNPFLALDDAMGAEQLKEVNGIYAMYSGDFNSDGVINVSDYDQWFQTPAAIGQYMETDANLDGVVQATDYGGSTIKRRLDTLRIKIEGLGTGY